MHMTRSFLMKYRFRDYVARGSRTNNDLDDAISNKIQEAGTVALLDYNN